jgi:hypothetical protein
MYRVTTSHLGPDARRTPSGEDMDRGDLSAEDLTVLLDAFVEIDPADNEEHDPHIRRGGPRGQADHQDEPGPAPGLRRPRPRGARRRDDGSRPSLQRLDRVESTSPFPGDADQPPPTAPHRGIAFAMLALGLS